MEGLHGLLEQFRAGGVPFIERVKDEGWPESLILDFKTASKNSGPMAPDDRGSLGTALSGFANSEGGLIVWGVLADRQAQDEPDVAKELRPIRKLSVFLSDLWAYTPQLVSPPIIGVNHEPLYLPGQPDTGYILSYIPKGEGDPHMNMSKGEQRYYCRSGASFIKMEHYMVADSFHRRAHPRIEFYYRISGQGQKVDGYEVDLIVGIRNTGVTLALYPALGVTISSHFSPTPHGLDGNRNNGLPPRVLARDRPMPLYHLYAGGQDQPIYPNMNYDVTRFTGRFASEVEYLPDITLQYELHCDGFAFRGETVIPGVDILRICSHRPVQR